MSHYLIFTCFLLLGVVFAYLGGFREAKNDGPASLRYLAAGEVSLLISLAPGWSFIGLPLFNWLDVAVPVIDGRALHALAVAALLFISSGVYILSVALVCTKIGYMRGRPAEFQA